LCFYIPSNQNEDAKFHVNSSLVNKRRIYRDTVHSSSGFTDYQLRPNLCIAMALAPELFDVTHARECLDVVENFLLAPLGMRTLDPQDWAYKPNYNNSQITDYTTSKGFNYHQGPEWLWPLGFFLRARIAFSTDKTLIVDYVHRQLQPHRNQILKSEWHGLPELTNQNASFCKDACPTQAWSMATLIDVFYDLHQLSSKE